MALVAIWALFFWRFVAPNPADRLTYEPGDFSETFGVFRDLGYRAALNGQLALWADCLWSGYPLHADPQAQTFYPPRWLSLAVLRALNVLRSSEGGHFPLDALVAETALHYLFTSLFFYLFLRAPRSSEGGRLRPAASLLGAVTFTYGGYLTGYPPLQNAVLATNLWLPLALLGAGRLAETRRPHDLALTALALTCAFLAGHPQTFVFVALVACAYFIFRAFRRRARLAAGRRRTPGVRALVQDGLWLGALLFLTAALSAAQLLPTLEFISQSTRASIPFEQAGHGFPFQDVLSFFIPGFVSYWSPLYVGLLPLGLALFALRLPDAERRFWAGLALAALVMAFGTQAVAYDAAYWTVPGLALFRGAERLALIVSAALAALAAFGADDALHALTRADRRVLNGITLATAVVFVIALLAVAVVTFGVYTGVAPQWTGLPERFGQWALMAGLALTAWLMRGRVPQLRRITPTVFIAFVVLDLFAANRPLNVRAPYLAYPPDPVIAPIVADSFADSGFFRVQDEGRLAGHAGCGYGFREVDGVTPYRLAAYDRLLQLPEPERWRLLGVKYVVTWRAELFTADGQRIESEVVAQSEDVDEKGNPTRTHRLRIEPQRAWLSNDLSGNETPPAADASALSVQRAECPSRCEGGQIILDVQVPAGAPRLLVVSEAYYPGWRVRVDGQPEAVRAAHGALLAVAIPPGAHTVEFRYEPQSLMWGMAISGAALLITAALIFAGWRGRRGMRPDPQAESHNPQSQIVYRPATAGDQKIINAIIREAEINPLGLKWSNFLVALDEASGEVVGTGQIRAHGDGSRELASIAVRPRYRNRGIASEIVRRLIARDARESTAPLYLLCAGNMSSFYERFGFRHAERAEMPPYFRRLTRLMNFAQVFVHTDLTPMVMVLDKA